MRLERKMADCWIGLYWRWDRARRGYAWLDIWLCLVPCLPIHLALYWRVPEAEISGEDES
jgi:hypothetical protein